jgi:hypothetical protein
VNRGPSPTGIRGAIPRKSRGRQRARQHEATLGGTEDVDHSAKRRWVFA